MKVIIPMAGHGSRFSVAAHLNPEFKKPKPLINVLGKPMINWAIDSLSSFNLTPNDFIFVTLKQHQLEPKLKSLFSPKIQVISISKATRGAAETALIAAKTVDPNEDIIISDSDHYFNGQIFCQTIKNKDSDTVGVIPVDTPIDNEIKHSYSLAPDNKYAIKIAEKDPVLAAQGAYSNIGAYYFSKAKTFVDQVENMIKKNLVSGPQGKQEFYVAPIYQRLLDQGKKVQIAVTKQAWRLGTPADLDYFLSSYHR
ncbi:NTP transferase domain-containing protein [Patescibacteria group bacterium]|nr:NTP transferase domain-containing protein [Patescibacteria group bacterium]MBU1256755.1 NTP transferase domain-containing protein [Patescibacteria group bacterium]MBU1457587.1 NTP transferase domain-containing protein [Patescibacteria group bacterium]